MPSFDIVKKSDIPNTFRVVDVISNFDIDTNHLEEHFCGSIDIEGIDWSIGLIVGGSGTGKTTVAKECFPDAYVFDYEYKSGAVIDDMPKGCSVKEIEHAFTSVGFASPPSWLRPYSVLSNGEKMRVDLARCLLEKRDLVVFDEFTSVVDRVVAKTASIAIAKAVRRSSGKFIAVSCHKDIIEYLQPDWIYDTDEQRFFIQRESSIAQNSTSKYIGLSQSIKKSYGTYFGSITI